MYEEAEVARAEPEKITDSRILQSKFSNLPIGWRKDFQAAIITLDTELMASQIDKIRPHNESLAKALERMVDNFEYDRILSFIQRSSDK